MTNRRFFRPALPFAAAAALFLAAPAAAQHDHGAAALPTTGLRAELIQDLDQLEEKYVGLAAAMAGKYEWRPGEGVRSAGEVFSHVANANLMLPTMAGVEMPAEFRGATREESRAKLMERDKITDAQQMQDVLKHAFAHVRQAIASVPDAELEAPTKLFGQDATKRRVLTLIVTHLHEHLGQSIAYARANGVVPPWSAGD
jgi:uncharacterized damage-inducible protein DinB